MRSVCAHFGVLVQPVPYLEEELGEFLFRDRCAVYTYALAHGNEVRRRVETYDVVRNRWM